MYVSRSFNDIQCIYHYNIVPRVAMSHVRYNSGAGDRQLTILNMSQPVHERQPHKALGGRVSRQHVQKCVQLDLLLDTSTHTTQTQH